MKSIEKFFDLPIGGYCGVLIREKTAKKLAKLLYKQTQEIKELLASDLSQLEVSDWSLIYPDGEQTTIHYYVEGSDQRKIDRINLFDKTKLISFCENGVFVAKNREDAQQAAMEWYEKIKM